MDRKLTKKARRAKAERAAQLDLSLDALRGEPADTPPSLIQAVDRAIEQIRMGAATVVVKGQTEHRARCSSFRFS